MDKDLQSRQEARELLRQAEAAQKVLAGFSQDKLDSIVKAVAEAFSQQFIGLLLPQAVSGVGRMHRITPRQRFVQTYARRGQDMQKTAPKGGF